MIRRDRPDGRASLDRGWLFTVSADCGLIEL